MIATSLSTRSCSTGLCGQCGPCRRQLRADDLILRPKALPPIELSPSVREIMAEDRKANKPKRRAIPKVQNRRNTTTPYVRPSQARNTETPSPCAECGEMRGYRILGGRGLGRSIDAVGDLCPVCADKPKLAATIATLEAKPQRTKSEHSALSRARLRIHRVTKDGRPYHPDASHGTGNAYVSYKCRCTECCAWSTADNVARGPR